MGAFTGLVMLAALAGVIWGFFTLLFRRGRRRQGLKVFGGSFAVLIAASLVFGSMDNSAREAGFASMAERNQAADAGFASPEAWRAHRAAAEAEAVEQKRVADAAAAEARERELADRAAQAAAAAEERAAREAAAAEERRVAMAAAEEAEVQEEAACRADIGCWGSKHRIDAEIRCKRPIERLARYEVEWTDGWTEPMFSRMGWADEERGTIRFMGDRVLFQNGFGARQNHVYACTYDPSTDTAAEIAAEPGRI